MATVGPKSLRMTGELAEGAILIGVNPTILKWSLEVMEKGAEKAGRSLDDIDKWARTMIYVAPSKEAARREVASYAATCACEMYRSLLRRTYAGGRGPAEPDGRGAAGHSGGDQSGL